MIKGASEDEEFAKKYNINKKKFDEIHEFVVNYGVGLKKSGNKEYILRNSREVLEKTGRWKKAETIIREKEEVMKELNDILGDEDFDYESLGTRDKQDIISKCIMLFGTSIPTPRRQNLLLTFAKEEPDPRKIGSDCVNYIKYSKETKQYTLYFYNYKGDFLLFLKIFIFISYFYSLTFK